MAFNADIGTPFANFPAPNDWFGFFHDFLTDEDLTEGVFTAISSGTNSVLDTLSGGYGRISGAATTDDSGGEWEQDAAVFTIESGKKIQFMWKGRMSDVTQSDFRAGIFKIDTSIIAGITDGIFFRSDDGDALLDISIWQGSAEVASFVGVATLVDATEFALAIEIIPSAEAVSVVNFYSINLTTKVSTLLGSMPCTLASSVLLTAAYAFQSGDASGTKTCDADYIGARKQR